MDVLLCFTGGDVTESLVGVFVGRALVAAVQQEQKDDVERSSRCWWIWTDRNKHLIKMPIPSHSSLPVNPRYAAKAPLSV